MSKRNKSSKKEKETLNTYTMHGGYNADWTSFSPSNILGFNSNLIELDNFINSSSNSLRNAINSYNYMIETDISTSNTVIENMNIASSNIFPYVSLNNTPTIDGIYYDLRQLYVYYNKEYTNACTAYKDF